MLVCMVDVEQFGQNGLIDNLLDANQVIIQEKHIVGKVSMIDRNRTCRSKSSTTQSIGSDNP